MGKGNAKKDDSAIYAKAVEEEHETKQNRSSEVEGFAEHAKMIKKKV